jgi:hypothetical protein
MPQAGELIKMPKDAKSGDKDKMKDKDKDKDLDLDKEKDKNKDKDLDKNKDKDKDKDTRNGAPPLPEVTPNTSSKATETETKNPFELDRRYEKRVDRAADYSWLTGQLFYVHADGGLWVLRYAPPGKEDPNGGGVILAGDRQLDSYREGDLVTVRGQIVKQKGSVFPGGPLYRAQSIQLIDRAQQ